MQNTIAYIHEKLHLIYDEREIRSFIHRILDSVCHWRTHDILLCKDKEISPNERQRIEDIVCRLQKQEPIQYILGETEFYGLSFNVNPEVLIPRPETEELVDLIIKEINATRGNRDGSVRVLDIGTGSGCIAVSLAKNIPDATVYAIDISPGALAIARQNAEKNQVDVSFVEHNIFNDFPEGILPDTWDVIVSNPPYVALSEKQNMESNVLDYEPHTALFVPDNQPLLFYERIAEFGLDKLNGKGTIYVETNARYGNETSEIFLRKNYKEVSLYKDMAGKDRIVKARLQG